MSDTSIASAFKGGKSTVVTASALDVVVDAILTELVTTQRVEALEPRNADLTHEIAALRAQPKALDYLGVWIGGGRVYDQNSVVTHRGSMWVAKRATNPSGHRRLAIACQGWTRREGDIAPERNTRHDIEPMSRLEGALCFMVYYARFDWRFAVDADGHLVGTMGIDLPMNRVRARCGSPPSCTS